MDAQSLEARVEALQRKLEVMEQTQRRGRWRKAALGVLGALGATIAYAQVPNTFTADTPALASEVNANFAYLDARSVPPGLIAFFNASTCPAGWGPVDALRGRTVVGLNVGGAMGALVGSALADQALPRHSHQWAFFDANRNWYSYLPDGGLKQVYNWDNGMDGVGADIYPLSADGGADTYYTEPTTTGMPYVQLLACAKL